MNDMGSLLFATSVLALGGLGLFMLKTDNNDADNDNKNDANEDEEKTELIDDVIDENADIKHNKVSSSKTRRNKKKQRASRRRI